MNTSFEHDDVIKWEHFPRSWPFLRGIHRSPVNSPHKGQWSGALMFSSICVWINDWVNSREAGDLIHYRAHYDVIVMKNCISHGLQNFCKVFHCKKTLRYYTLIGQYIVSLWKKNTFCIASSVWYAAIWIRPNHYEWFLYKWYTRLYIALSLKRHATSTGSHPRDNVSCAVKILLVALYIC